MRVYFVLAALALTLGGADVTAATGTPPRFALIVGNSQYEELVDLPNPVRDSRLIAETVRGLGFQVEERSDQGRREMLEAIAAFGRRLGEAGPDAVAFFFYAGHAVQMGGRNFLLPTDTAADRDTMAGGVEVGAVLGTLASAENGQKFVVLDSCRDKPLDSSPDASRGLAAMQAPPGTMIAYSTAPGRVAFDGAGLNSPYTAALARRLMDSPLPAEELFKEVRAAVMQATGGHQTPWEDSSLIGGDFFFNLARRPLDDSEEALWDRTKNRSEAEYFQSFLARYPDGTFSGLARRRLAAITGGGTRRGLEEARETSNELAIREAAAESFEEGWVAFKRSNFVDAARWYEKAARFGHAEAGFNLALLYFRGKGVDRDYEASERWARMAADQGFAAAVDFLNVLAVVRTPAGAADD